MEEQEADETRRDWTFPNAIKAPQTFSNCSIFFTFHFRFMTFLLDDFIILLKCLKNMDFVALEISISLKRSLFLK